MGTPTSRFAVADLGLWGRLVKSWATHLDYVSQDYPYQPPRAYWVNTSWNDPGLPAPQTVTDVDAQGKPKPWCLPKMTAVSIPRSDHTTVTLPGAVALTVAEFEALAVAGHVTIQNMPTQYTNVVIVQGAGDTLVFRLPPAETIESSEDDLVNGVNYVIPAFYDALYGGPPTIMPAMPNQGSVMELHASRIGEYTLNSCV
jgi:hypothetical protein